MSKPGYPVWWEDTVTIYNKFTDPQTSVTTWYRNVVTDCFWKLVGSQVRVGEVVLDSKSIVCRVPKDDKFREKQVWLALPNDEKGDYFTFGSGDIIVKGECDFIIDENTRGHRSTDLLNKYKEYQACMEITDFTNDTGTGKNNEHYLTRGK